MSKPPPHHRPRPWVYLPAWMDRRRDHRVRPPSDLVAAPADPVPAGTAIGLALQHLSVQAVYLLLPLAVARAVGLDPAMTVQFLSLTLFAMAVTTALHTVWRGPVGSGYPLSCIPSPVALSSYVGLGALALTPFEAAPSIILAGLASLVLVLLLPGLLRRLPVEVAGVVSFVLGMSLLPVAAEMGLRTPPDPWVSGFAVLVLVGIVVANVANWRFASFGLLLGGAVGAAIAIAIWTPASATLAELWSKPLFSLPVLALPPVTELRLDVTLAFLVVFMGLLPGVLANVLTLQRLGNADWLKPDPGPLQRSFVATSLGLLSAGALGGMAATTSAGGVGLTAATRLMSRRVIWVNTAMLVALACSPWLLGHLLLLPAPVSAAMLLFIACFMLGSGMQQIAGRVLDKRRTCVVGLGLSAAFLDLLARDHLAALLPAALLGPVTLGFLVSLSVHVLTLPLVTRRTEAVIPLDEGAPRALERFVTASAGAFGLRRATAEAAAHAVIEVGEILAARGVPRLEAEMRVADNRVRLVLRHAGAPLPRPARDPKAHDVAAGEDAREAFAMWLAARAADACVPRALPQGAQLVLEFSE